MTRTLGRRLAEPFITPQNIVRLFIQHTDNFSGKLIYQAKMKIFKSINKMCERLPF
jgi:hypothetical protein